MSVKDRAKKRARVEMIRTRDEATAVAISTAELEMKREEAALLRDKRIAALNEEFELTIEEFGRAIEDNVKRLRAWAVANREGEFGKRQSITLAGHTLKFREGTGSVEFLPGHDADGLLEALAEVEDDSLFDRFAAVKTTLDKNAVIAAWKAEGSAWAWLEERGVRVVKKETFTFSANRDALENPTTLRD